MTSTTSTTRAAGTTGSTGSSEPGAAPAAAESTEKATRRTRKTGIVVSAKMEKTVVVEVTRSIRNPRYGKFQKKSARFLADDRVLGAKVGDTVEIEETRPLSARKRWRVKAIVTAGRREA